MSYGTAIAGILAKHPSIDFALLFGSTARDQARHDSDVDLLVGGAHAVDSLQLRAELVESLGRDVDVIIAKNAPIPLLEEVMRDGVIVFERIPGAGALFRSRTLAQLETDRPWYRRMSDAYLRRVAESGI